MTTASDVHLFAWMKENWTILGSFLVVIWAMTVYWFRTIVIKYYSREEIDSRIDEKINRCKMTVDNQDKVIESKLDKVAASVKDMRTEQREDAKEQNEKHEKLIHDIGLLHGKMDS